ncbi:MAG: thioredoxin, partial [Prevotella sp.]|nr:thioredoxin [Prevotella sp.]
DVCSKYGIRGFPTKILVGPDGKIVKTVVGEDPEFYTLLDSLFK